MILFRDGNMVAQGDRLEYSLTLGRGEKARMALSAIGGPEPQSIVLHVDIAGPDADFRMDGVYVCTGEEKVGIKVNLTHSSGGSISDQMFRGIAAGKSRVSFDGLIKVVPDAQKTEAYQTSRNLLLSDDAQVLTSPQLEIYADDVKCSHGAAVGSLDEDEQFYMRSRGITLDEAKRLQMLSFLAPVTESLPEEAREAVYDKLASLSE